MRTLRNRSNSNENVTTLSSDFISFFGVNPSKIGKRNSRICVRIANAPSARLSLQDRSEVSILICLKWWHNTKNAMVPRLCSNMIIIQISHVSRRKECLLHEDSLSLVLQILQNIPFELNFPKCNSNLRIEFSNLLLCFCYV